MTTPDTSLDAYKAIRDAGDDVSLRRRVAAAIATEPLTTHELLQQFPDNSANAIRPRVNELLRMGCVERDGKRTNPSGHDAYVHHITLTGKRYLRGEIDPEPGPTVKEQQATVVQVARAVLRGDADLDVLQIAVEQHDTVKHRLDPEWEPPGGEVDDA